VAAACGSTSTDAGGGTKDQATIRVVAAENEYGNVAAQIGGRFVTVTSVESNPNTDPHTYEVSPGVAEAVSAAQVVVQNGVGYDDFMTRVESASTSASRRVIDVQRLLGRPDDTPNPHLWYDPETMPKVAHALAAAFGRFEPGRAEFFESKAQAFVASLSPWSRALARFRAQYPNTAVATTEPVADYMLQAAGVRNLTPFAFQADIMNGVDPSPQDVSLETSLLTGHRVKALVYNEQVTDALTQSFIAAASRAGVPVVGVYETMPVPGFDYQTWMVAEVQALQRAVADKVSTVKL
jgi:zinc/manganese transport system substrate-binding protein